LIHAPGIQRDINQKVNAGLITLMDAKILNKYLADRQISTFCDYPENGSMTQEILIILF